MRVIGPACLVLPVVTGQPTVGVVDDHLLLQVHVGPVQPLVLLELAHGLTEREPPLGSLVSYTLLRSLITNAYTETYSCVVWCGYEVRGVV